MQKNSPCGWMVSPTLSWLSGCVLALWHLVALCGTLRLSGRLSSSGTDANCQHAGGCRAQRHGAGTRRHWEQYISGNTALPIQYEGLTLNSALVRTVFMLYTPITLQCCKISKFRNRSTARRRHSSAREAASPSAEPALPPLEPQPARNLI